MAQRTCQIDGCDSRSLARGWCSKHYQRWKRHGDPLVTMRRESGPCKVDECDKPGDEGHGWCYLHYRRYWRHGDPYATSRIVGDDVARFVSYLIPGEAPTHVPELGPCWLWDGLLTRDGYGVMASDLPTQSAHRWSYRHHVGDLPPDGYDLDHLCRNRPCVNPYHLDPVPHAVNVRRAQDVKHGRSA